MRSLRSLCLLKVHALGLPTPDLSPIPSLARDIKIMQMFNRSFIEREAYYVHNTVFQDAISIQYDGASWTILYRTNQFHVNCCPCCDFVEPVLHQFTVEEGQLSPVPPQFRSEHFHQGFNAEDLMMSISITMEDDGTSVQIKLRFLRDCVPVGVDANLTVRMIAGQWMADFHEFVDVLNVDTDYYLPETPDPIQDVFATPVYPSCIREALGHTRYGLDEVTAAVKKGKKRRKERRRKERVLGFWELVFVFCILAWLGLEACILSNNACSY
eukprot:GFUD01037129.1.p1 GENE.GFUD01037129.1~~GFUD01037129.1.p1  ORF type:complete len:270 (-),score=29.09 GFUD01037129.1:20-829(-)